MIDFTPTMQKPLLLDGVIFYTSDLGIKKPGSLGTLEGIIVNGGNGKFQQLASLKSAEVQTVSIMIPLVTQEIQDLLFTWYNKGNRKQINIQHEGIQYVSYLKEIPKGLQINAKDIEFELMPLNNLY